MTLQFFKKMGLFLSVFAFSVFMRVPVIYSEEEQPQITSREQNFILGVTKIYRLTLEEVTKLALENNFDIQLAKYDTWIKRTDQDVAESIYDTILSAEVKYEDDQRKKTSTISGNKTVNNDYNMSLSKKLPSGTTLDLDMTNNRKWTNSAFVTSSLTHESKLGMSLTQELGKNFLGIQDRGDVKISKIDIENTEYASLGKIEDKIAEVQKAYWDLVYQSEMLKIEEEMVVQAKRLYDLNQEKLINGLVEIPEAVASEANYISRKNDLMFVRNQLKTKVNILKLLLNITDEDIQIEPAYDLKISDISLTFPEALKETFTHRRDYKKALNDIRSKDIKLTMKKNNIWPEINLTASLERNGLGDHFKQAVTQITEEDHPKLFAGLTFNFPLENKDAMAQLKAAQLEKAKVLLNLKLLERQITIDVIDQLRDCNVFKEIAFNSTQIAQLQTKKLEEEEKRFLHGRSDTDTLIRFQEDLIKAKESAVEAARRYHSALVDLLVKEGTLLNQYWDGEI